MKLKKEIEISKETYELGSGIATFLGDFKKALDDGFQAGTDIPEIITSAIDNLVPAVKGIELIDDEWFEDEEVFLQTIIMIGLEVARNFRKNKKNIKKK